MNQTSTGVWQYIGLIFTPGLLGGGYWYWLARAGLGENTSRNTSLTNGLVGSWPFDRAYISGTTAYDRGGQGNNGTLLNNLTKTGSMIGQALSFIVTSQKVDAGNNTSLQLKSPRSTITEGDNFSS